MFAVSGGVQLTNWSLLSFRLNSTVILNHCAAALLCAASYKSVTPNYKNKPPNFRYIILDIFCIKSILFINL